MNAPLPRNDSADSALAGSQHVAGGLFAPLPEDVDAATLRRLIDGQCRVMQCLAGQIKVNETLTTIASICDATVQHARCVIAYGATDESAISLVSASEQRPGEMSADLADLAEGEGTGRWIAQPATSAFGAAAAELAQSHADHGVWCETFRAVSGPQFGVLLIYPLAAGEGPAMADRQICRLLADMARCAIEVEQREIAHEEVNQRITALTKTVPGVIYQRVVKPDGDIRYTYISDAARDLFGVEPQDIIAEPQALFGRHGPEYAASFRERLLTASRDLTDWDVEATIITPAGDKKHTHAIARPYKAPDGSVVWNGVILDQTRIKEAELAAQSAEARTRETIIESIPQGFILFDPEGRFVTCNSIFLELYPFLRDQVSAGTTFEDVVRAEIAEQLDEDGAIADPADRLAARLEGAKSGDHAFERRLQDGEWILVNERCTAEGSIVVLHTVVTELKERETALQRSNRELEDFAFVASHDLQEPLRKIEAFGGRLRTSLPQDLDNKTQLYLDRMLNAAERMRILIADLLAYSRVTTKANPFMSVSLDRIAGDVINDLQVTIEETRAEIDIGPLPTIDADPTQMRMLVQNLLSNALKYRKPDEAPRISIAAEVNNDQAAGAKLPFAGANTVSITVTDNGIGFDMKYAERIFAIFQRLHGRNEYEGTGIGLATCRKIVERHGGTVVVDSEVGRGSRFVVTLPVKQAFVETVQ